MRKYIIFRADKAELEKYRSLTATKVGESFYRVANAGSVKSLIWTIAEHYDSSGKTSPVPGDRLTESVIVESAIDPMFPSASTHFRDSKLSDLSSIENPVLLVGCFPKFQTCPKSSNTIG